jgi:hypothetical protein
MTNEPRPAGNWVIVALAWSAVLIPLGWGVWKTLLLARQLFR